MNSRWMRIACIGLAVVALMCFGIGSATAANCPVKAPAGLLESGTLIVGTALDSAPMSFMGPGNRPTGIDVELARAIADTMCLQPKFLNITFTGLLPALGAKKVDILIARLGITEERKKAFDFVPYFLAGVQLITKKDSNLYFNQESDVCGYSTSLQDGSVEMVALERVKDKCPPNRPMTLKMYPNNNEALEQLRKGTTQVAFVDYPIASYVTSQTQMFQVASPILSGDGPGTPRHRDGVVVRKGDKEMYSAVEQSIKILQANGTYQKILAQFSLLGGYFDLSKEKY
ncbi:MAG: ABC transporter substrate-binding protein [Candidatus Korobacteraceae bacterium]|jgi:polar amino acid transport system substrate-binding protein